jgi:hypothetical protein
MSSAKTIFVFDFDLTLTMDHSGGFPFSDQDYMKGQLPNLVKMLETLNELGVIVYINTRGIVGDYPFSVKTYLQARLGPKYRTLIRDVYGAVPSEEVDEDGIPFLEFSPDYDLRGVISRTDSEFRTRYLPNFIGKRITQRTKLNPDDDTLWALHKVCILEKIKRDEEVTKNQIYFFDDTKINIEVAKWFGFSHSYCITEKNLLQTIKLVDKELSKLKAEVRKRFILERQDSMLTQQQKQSVVSTMMTSHKSIPAAKSSIARLGNKGKNRDLESLSHILESLSRLQYKKSSKK